MKVLVSHLAWFAHRVRVRKAIMDVLHSLRLHGGIKDNVWTSIPTLLYYQESLRYRTNLPNSSLNIWVFWAKIFFLINIIIIIVSFFIFFFLDFGSCWLKQFGKIFKRRWVRTWSNTQQLQLSVFMRLSFLSQYSCLCKVHKKLEKFNVILGWLVTWKKRRGDKQKSPNVAI